MKKIFKYIIPCMALAFAMTSCDSTMDDKASIDAQYAKASSATVSLTAASAVDFQTITAAVSVGNHSEVVEEGVQISTAADFSANVTSVPNDTVDASFEVTKGGLAEQTSYYVRAYAVTKTAGTIVTEAQTITTPKAPIFPIDGKYTAIEWGFNDETGEWEAGAPYEVTVEFDAADPTMINITNIWDGGMTVKGQYDEAKGTITVPNEQVIYVHPSYGDVWIQGVNSAISAYTDAVTFQFTALGGKMQSTPMGAVCGAGSFGYFYLTMEHQ